GPQPAELGPDVPAVFGLLGKSATGERGRPRHTGGRYLGDPVRSADRGHGDAVERGAGELVPHSGVRVAFGQSAGLAEHGRSGPLPVCRAVLVLGRCEGEAIRCGSRSHASTIGAVSHPEGTGLACWNVTVDTSTA